METDDCWSNGCRARAMEDVGAPGDTLVEDLTIRPRLIFSLTPKWIEKILSGKKTFELRRRPPKISQPTISYLYETRPHSRIRARCLLGPVISDSPNLLWRIVGDHCGVERSFFESYFSGLEEAHALPITQVMDLGSQFTLPRLRAVGFHPPQAWAYVSSKVVMLVEGAQ